MSEGSSALRRLKASNLIRGKTDGYNYNLIEKNVANLDSYLFSWTFPLDWHQYRYPLHDISTPLPWTWRALMNQKPVIGFASRDVRIMSADKERLKPTSILSTCRNNLFINACYRLYALSILIQSCTLLSVYRLLLMVSEGARQRAINARYTTHWSSLKNMTTPP